MRRPWGISRRWLILGGVGAGLVLLTGLGLGVIYPKVGAYMIRSRVGDRLGTRIDRQITFGSIDVTIGHAVLRDISVRGPNDGDLPLVHVDRVDVDFDGWKALFGTIELGEAKVDGVVATLRRDAKGNDNVLDVIEHLRAKPGGETSGGHSPRPTKLTVTHARLFANDDQTGTTALVADGDATWTPAGLVAHARDATATTVSAPKAVVKTIEIDKPAGESPTIKLDGGELSVTFERPTTKEDGTPGPVETYKFELTGIGGDIAANADRSGQYTIGLAGGYGGVPGKLWTAKGSLDPKAVKAGLDLEAAKFQLDRLAPILQHSAIVDYQATSVDTKLHLDMDRVGVAFAGGFHLSGLNVGHPYIADKEVHDLDLSGDIAGTFDRATRKLELTKGDFLARNVKFSLTGNLVAPRVVNLEPPNPPKKNPDGSDHFPPMRGPHGIQQLEARLVIPPIACQKMLDAFPVEMVPYMHGYKVRGMFDVDIRTAIDWSDLDSLDLGGAVGINKCKVLDEPADSPKRLKDEFEQYVETEKGEWQSFIVGPNNPDFVPLEQVSPFLLKSIQSSEDFGFYKHHGFIVSEFRTALINNLKHEKFVQGASSITMQMVKNVLLYREKTLARKLQELFLTWHVENTLEKDRIFEIYLNVIEFGPGLYGIGPAAHYYFGKSAKDLNAVESAFFSSILPDPKGRSEQYCTNTLTKWTKSKIEHMLGNQLKRKQLTQEEYDKAMATPLLFYKTWDSETEEDCLKRVKKAIKNARPTNPLKDKEDDAKHLGDKKSHKQKHRPKRTE
jgi:hypothetical protein